MGRPRLSDQSAKDVLIGARLGIDEVKQAEHFVKESGLTKSEWVRAVLMNPPKIKTPPDSPEFWGSIPFSRQEMNGKRVEFEMLVKWEEYDTPRKTCGTGHFLIRQKKDETDVVYHVQIIARYSQEREKVIDLTSAMTALIKRNKESSNCEFSLTTSQ
jgi:hypothetical protein